MTVTATEAEPDADAAPAARTIAPTRIPHVDALDGLRGAAVAAVLLHHAGHLTGGWLGVDLFFVLSGYLITALLLTGWRQDGDVGLRTFWVRRARRLAPALIVTLVAVGAYAAWVASPLERLGIRWDGIATLFEVQNWRVIATNTDYFAHRLRESPLAHTWSLSIEEQLYLVWPLLVAAVLAWRRSPRAVLVAAVGGAVASAGLLVALHAGGASQTRLYNGTDTRAAAVLLGAAVAALRVVLGPAGWARTRQLRQGLGLVAAAGLAVAWAQLDGTSDVVYQGGLALAGLAGALVVAAVADRRHPGPLGTVLAVWPLAALGRISYGVYLYHLPIYLVLDQQRTGLSGWTLITVQIGVTLVAAAASARFLEEPIRRGRLIEPGRQARAALPAGAALAVLALFAGTLGAVPPPSAADLATVVNRSSVPGAPVVLLAGDSVPLMLGVELANQTDQLAVSLANRALPGCHLLASLGPIQGSEGNIRDEVSDCSAQGEYRSRVRAVRPTLSIVFFGEFPNEAVRIGGRWLRPCQPEYLSALRSRLDSLVDDLRATKAPVVLVTAPGSSISWIVDRAAPGMDERVACTNEVVTELAAERPGVSVVDLASYVCPPGQPCLETIDGANLRPDGLHFTGDGARVINAWLIPKAITASQTG